MQWERHGPSVPQGAPASQTPADQRTTASCRSLAFLAVTQALGPHSLGSCKWVSTIRPKWSAGTPYALTVERRIVADQVATGLSQCVSQHLNLRRGRVCTRRDRGGACTMARPAAPVAPPDWIAAMDGPPSFSLSRQSRIALRAQRLACRLALRGGW